MLCTSAPVSTGAAARVRCAALVVAVACGRLTGYCAVAVLGALAGCANQEDKEYEYIPPEKVMSKLKYHAE